MSLSTHLVRRGMEAAHRGMVAATAGSDQPAGGDAPRVSPLAGMVFILSSLIFLVLLFSVGYTYGHLLPILCMVESPETEAYVPVGTIEPTDPPAYSATPAPKPAHGQPDGPEDDTDGDAEVLLVRNKPFTASIRQTILHLRARAGYWSRFRGLSMFLAWNMVGGFLISIIANIFPNRLGIAVAAIIAETALATWHMAWVHIVISEPSEKRWYKRIPTLRTWPKIAPAVALWATTHQVVAILPMLVCGSFGSLKHMDNPDYKPGRKDLYAVGGQGILGFSLMVALFVLLQIPATVTLVRVAASMLPEEDETIVPFDRTFGGKTTPAIIGGQGKIGLVEAWRSFSWESRMRLLRLMAKVTLIFLACWLLFTIVLVAEAHILFGDKLGEMMKTVHGIARAHQ
ncbi:uncharacterized protein PV07_09709 [Cladophialophora immunda]|uniref:Ubiquitin carrier protein n=1 Tax=Cladophialophora immunda TaxID=569365 RepID=A0A0D2AGG2_9EURO|nr:uncharacterized protein PV07_09709 [Cladophialophora immunda]KIW23967.1 hypothetical protein PV07_09709 [Cladophialophora immunda]OQV08287.1 hypothetical protein CLAIMM_12590 [Cladophialophora immunda]